MLSIGKRAAGLGATVAAIAALAPVTGAGAATVPIGIVGGPAAGINPTNSMAWTAPEYSAGGDAALAAWQAGAIAGLGAWQAGTVSTLAAFQSATAALPPGALATLTSPAMPAP